MLCAGSHSLISHCSFQFPPALLVCEEVGVHGLSSLDSIHHTETLKNFFEEKEKGARVGQKGGGILPCAW